MTPAVGEVWRAMGGDIAGKRVRVLSVNDNRVIVVDTRSRRGTSMTLERFVKRYYAEAPATPTPQHGGSR